MPWVEEFTEWGQNFLLPVFMRFSGIFVQMSENFHAKVCTPIVCWMSRWSCLIWNNFVHSGHKFKIKILQSGIQVTINYMFLKLYLQNSQLMRKNSELWGLVRFLTYTRYFCILWPRPFEPIINGGWNGTVEDCLYHICISFEEVSL